MTNRIEDHSWEVKGDMTASEMSRLLERAKEEVTKKTNALEVQVGGGHYKHFPIQPVEYCQLNKLPFAESCIIKYVSRHMSKNGIEDLRKAKHFLELLAHIEYGEEL